MLIILAIILLIAWFLGIIGVYTLGWFVHILLILAIIALIVAVIKRV
ncbi:MAG TPA: lmo0937 family membrane protein [Candidatus Paceibacterota bacterium]